MKLEQQVANLELSKRLREIGVKQESLYYWGEDASGVRLISNKTYPDTFNKVNPYAKFYSAIDDGDDIYETGILCSAFTVAELGELLPGGKGYMPSKLNNNEWAIVYGTTLLGGDFSEADARARMLIYLLEEGLCQA